MVAEGRNAIDDWDAAFRLTEIWQYDEFRVLAAFRLRISVLPEILAAASKVCWFQ